MNHRFYCQMAADGSRVTLAGGEAHHLLHVLRAQAGDEITLFDGTGREYTARITATSRRDVQLEVLDQQAVDRESPHDVTLGVAFPKGDRQRFLVEKCVELGVRCVVPLVLERTVSQTRGAALDRLRRAVIEASKQCGRNRLMQIAEPQGWEPYLRSAAPGAICWVADPRGPCSEERVPRQGETVQLAVGPEGGFTDGELALARQFGWFVVGLGPRILRVETAALALAARWM